LLKNNLCIVCIVCICAKCESTTITECQKVHCCERGKRGKHGNMASPVQSENLRIREEDGKLECGNIRSSGPRAARARCSQLELLHCTLHVLPLLWRLLPVPPTSAGRHSHALSGRRSGPSPIPPNSSRSRIPILPRAPFARDRVGVVGQVEPRRGRRGGQVSRASRRHRHWHPHRAPPPAECRTARSQLVNLCGGFEEHLESGECHKRVVARIVHLACVFGLDANRAEEVRERERRPGLPW